MTEPEDLIDRRRESECCGAPIYTDTDVCSCCGEHCDDATDMMNCPDCDGAGWVYDNNFMPNNPNLIDRPHKKCSLCSGTGIIERIE